MLPSLTTLELLVSPTFLTVEEFATLLGCCPAVTSIALTMRLEDELLSFLHCLAHIGRYCSLIEQVTVTFDRRPSWPSRSTDRQLFSVDDVSGVVDQYDMPAHAFHSLRCVREVGCAIHEMSEEAAGYVQQCWMSNVPASVRLPHTTAMTLQ